VSGRSLPYRVPGVPGPYSFYLGVLLPLSLPIYSLILFIYYIRLDRQAKRRDVSKSTETVFLVLGGITTMAHEGI